MEFLKKHADAATVIGLMFSLAIWNHSEFKDIRRDISDLKQDVAIIKTVLVLNKMLPPDLAILENKN
jgi:hypothetical protein